MWCRNNWRSLKDWSHLLLVYYLLRLFHNPIRHTWLWRCIHILWFTNLRLFVTLFRAPIWRCPLFKRSFETFLFFIVASWHYMPYMTLNFILVVTVNVAAGGTSTRKAMIKIRSPYHRQILIIKFILINTSRSIIVGIHITNDHEANNTKYQKQIFFK